MLRKMRIQNFKIWKDTGAITMAPITLFFGSNSSGKSSIGQFLMMLKQTVESSDRKAVFSPGGKSSAVDLGSFKEMVFGRNMKNRISFEYQWNLPKMMTVKDLISQKTFSGDTLAFSAIIGMNNSDNYSVLVDEFYYRLLNKEGNETLKIGLKRRQESRTEYKVEAEQYPLKRKKGRVWPIGAPVRFYGFPDEVVAYRQNADFVQTLNLYQEKLFQGISYLGPLRIKPERLYSWKGIEPESVGYSGEQCVAAILAARGRKISLGPKKHKKSFEEIIAEKLKDMGLIEDFEITPISEQRQEYEVRVRTKGFNNHVELPDVGFGISQVLPVLVQSFYAPPDSIIIMEQPEIHLHPAAQSALADVMIDVINSQEDGTNRNIQLIIETHSEHFLRRLQRRIAEGALAQDKISVYFANVNESPAILEPLKIDEYGTILNWPEHFFGDEMGDITEQARAAMRRRKENIDNSKKEVNEKDAC